MVVVDILCIYSCIKLILYYRPYKKVYYILKGKSWLDRFIIKLLSYIGWEFILLEYEYSSTNSHSSFIDVQKDLMATMAKHIRPSIEKQINSCDFFSNYEKKRISTYIELSEKKNLYRYIEILHILSLLKDQDIMPKEILLHWSRWKSVISSIYKEKGYNVKFYRIYSPLKLQTRKQYVRDRLVVEAVKRTALFNLFLIFYKISLNIFYCMYFFISKHMQPDISSKIGKFDICAFVPGYFGTKWINDLHWKKIQSGNRYRTLAMLYGKFDKSVYSTYAHLAEKWISLGKLNSPPYVYSIYNWLWPMYPKMLGWILIRLVSKILSSNILWDYKIRIIYLFTEVGKFELLFKITDVKLFWSSVEGDHFESIAATIAINRIGGVSLGATWSICGLPGPSAQRNINDIFFIWGDRHAKIFLEGGIVFKSMIIAGYPCDYYLKDYLSKAFVLRQKWKGQYNNKKILCFYDNFIRKDAGYNFSNVVDYVKNLLLWIGKEPETVLVIKSKGKQTSNMYSYLAELLKILEDQKRLIYEFEAGDLAPGFASELVIGLSVETLPCLLGTYGKDVILFNDNRYQERWPINANNIKFITRPKDIIKILDNWKKEVHENTAGKEKIEINPKPNQFDSFVDGRSVERITEYVSSLITGLRRGLSSDGVIHNTNRLYQEKWGEDKIVETINIGECR